MFPWLVAFLSAVIMMLIEYLVLIRVYKKSYGRDIMIFLIPPFLLILAQFITYKIQDKENMERDTLNPFILLIVFIILKFPFSFSKHDIVPDISLFERLVISGAEAVSATIFAEGLVILLKKM